MSLKSLNLGSSPASLRRQLLTGGLLLLLALGLATAVGAFLLFERFQGRITGAALEASSERLLAAIRQSGQGPWLDLERVDPSYQRPLSGEYFLITFEDGTWRSRSLWDTELLLPERYPDSGAFQIHGPGDQKLRVLVRTYQRHGRNFQIAVATDVSVPQEAFESALLRFAVFWAAALLFTGILLVWWLGRALSPLDRIRARVERMAVGELQPLPEDAPRELLPLIQQLNRLLDQTRAALQRSRNALGNLGHAFKTPLAVLRQLAEREEVRRHVELHQAIRYQLDLLTDRVDRELGREYIQSGVVTERFTPGRELPLIIESLTRAHGRRLTVRQQLEPDDELPFDRADLLEASGNLLDNAWKWAHSTVVVRCAIEHGQWVLLVEDDGPGIDDAGDRQRALERGGRVDESVAGQGLGLAIVADIVEAYQGELRLQPSRLGGLAIEVRLPLNTKRDQGS